jgi:hypothetical protein
MLLSYRPRAWHLVVVAFIALFDLAVLYMVVRPHVSDEYRDYYITRTASCFPRVIDGYYPLGTPISFVPGRNGYQRDTVRWCGFMPPSSTGIRSFGDYGTLKLKFPVPDDDLLLTFSSWANTSSDRPAWEVHVLVNNEPIGVLTFNSAARVNGRFVIPKRVAQAGDGGLEIRFDVPRTGPPGTNSEPITLQLRLEALRVSALGTTIQTGETDPPAATDKKEAGSPPPPGSRKGR